MAAMTKKQGSVLERPSIKQYKTVLGCICAIRHCSNPVLDQKRGDTATTN